MSFLPPAHPSLTHLRTFTSSARLFARSTKEKLKAAHKDVPAYPYGPSQIYKQSNFGLYGHQKIRFGNMVSEKNEIKTRRYWRPNVHSKRLWSDGLNKFIRTRVTTRVLRTIDKCGGLDEYLLGEKANRVKELGMGGWKLRWRIMQSPKVRERFRLERLRMGLVEPEVLVGLNGQLVTEAQVKEEMQQIDEELAEGEELGLGEDAQDIALETLPEAAPGHGKVVL